jgi:hypothetical protein
VLFFDDKFYDLSVLEKVRGYTLRRGLYIRRLLVRLKQAESLSGLRNYHT